MPYSVVVIAVNKAFFYSATITFAEYCPTEPFHIVAKPVIPQENQEDSSNALDDAFVKYFVDKTNLSLDTALTGSSYLGFFSIYID